MSKLKMLRAFSNSEYLYGYQWKLTSKKRLRGYFAIQGDTF